MKEGIVLFAHGSREPDWAKPFESIAALLARKFLVRVAYLELMRPSLDEAVGALAAAGARRVRIVPVFFGQGGHVRQDLPKLAAAARARHPELEIVLERTIGERPEVIEALAALISEAISHEPR